MSNGTSERARNAKREYMRKWRSEHREKVRAAQERYWDKRGEKMNQEQTAAADPGRREEE